MQTSLYQIKVQVKSLNVRSYTACSFCGRKTEVEVNQTFDCQSCNNKSKATPR
ncbi:hypothetical protein AXF42_Ash010690 [Apostasia shenzhenica]|uniref:Uncharacterized protein n=1 Tax=Apostasia shenzhenica TaxID=1088818 RepID=A0A2I0A6S6_9ASPA|nr:hypothetical protein AXF42_Ash010690 [Apostasia shenzhenica]